MRKNNRKGFTIVELVIVIAVIAILAAVLIPTFVSLVNKANQSADQQAVTNMNKILLTEDKVDNVDDVIAILIKNEYAGDLTTYYAKYQLAWIAEENVIVLIENDAIVYPENYVDKGLTYEVITPMAKDAASLNDGLTDGRVVYVADDVRVEGLKPDKTGKYATNLNGNTLNSTGYIGSNNSGTELVISNGIIESSYVNTEAGDGAVMAENGGKVELKNVQVYAANGVNPLQCYGGTMVLNNVTVAQSGESDDAEWHDSAIQVVNHLSKDENGKYAFDGKQADLTVYSGMYSGEKAIQLDSPGYTIVIYGGTFVGTDYAINADYNDGYASQGAKYSITINGGSFTGAIRISSANITCVINGGTFSVDPSTITNAVVAGTVVDNQNGTWTVK